MIYVVLGMHKSGTTLLSQILHHSGINMGEGFEKGISYDDGNKYERVSSLELNVKILGAPDYEVRDLPKPSQLALSDAQRLQMREIIERCNNRYQNWGFKDPRTSLTYPLWKGELPRHRIIAIYRSPEEIWPRFRWQGWRKRYVNPVWAWQFMSRWMEHNIGMISYLREAGEEYILLDYHRLMTTDSEFIRLQTFVGTDLVDMRNRQLYRAKKKRADLPLRLAAWLIKVTSGRSKSEIMQTLENLRASEIQEKRVAENS